MASRRLTSLFGTLCVLLASFLVAAEKGYAHSHDRGNSHHQHGGGDAHHHHHSDSQDAEDSKPLELTFTSSCSKVLLKSDAPKAATQSFVVADGGALFSLAHPVFDSRGLFRPPDIAAAFPLSDSTKERLVSLSLAQNAPPRL